jgi:iron complex outermembrane receptor protein
MPSIDRSRAVARGTAVRDARRRSPALSALLRLVATLTLAFAAGVPIALAQTPGAVRQWDQPAASLGDALNRFARRAGVTLAFDPALVARRTAPALVGEFTARSGLAALLAGSGLEAVESDGAWTVRAATATPGSGGSAARSPAEDEALPTVVVTADRPADFTAPVARLGVLGDREVRDTPVSIASYTRDLMDRQQAVNLAEVLRNDPSVTSALTAGGFSAGFLGLRGFVGGSDAFAYDGMGPGLPLFVLQGTLEATERFELIKGPTGVAGGVAPFGAIGGSVNLVPKKPLDVPLSSITLGWRQQGAVRAHVDLSRRFGVDEQFGLRVNVVHEEGEARVDRTYDRRQVLAIAGDWKVRDNLRLEAGWNHFFIRNEGYQANFQLAPGLAVPTPGDATRNRFQPWGYVESQIQFGTLAAHWDFAPRWTLTLRGLEGDSPREGVASPASTIQNAAGAMAAPFLYIAPGGSYMFNSQQAIVKGAFETGPIGHDVTLGANRDAWSIDQGAAPLGFFASNFFNPVYANAPMLPGNVAIRRTNDSLAESLFVSDNLRLGERVSVLLGARSSRFRYRNLSPVTGNPTLDQEDQATTPLAGVVFKPNVATSLYANYAEGLLRGGQAPVTAVNASQLMPSIVAKQMEAGVKWESARGLLLTGALFDIERPLEYLDASNRFIQSGRQHHRGVELTAAGKVSREFAVIGGAMWIDAKQEGTGNPATEGRTALGVPQYTLPLYVTWQPGFVPGLTLSAGVQHFGRQYIDATNARELPAWTRWDAGLRFSTRAIAQVTTFSLNVENLLDERYWASAAQGTLALGAPLTVRGAVRVDF